MDWDLVLSSWAWTVYAEGEVRDLLSTNVAHSQYPRPWWQFRLELAPVWMTTFEAVICHFEASFQHHTFNITFI